MVKKSQNSNDEIKQGNKDYDRDMRFGRSGIESNRGISGEKDFGSKPNQGREIDKAGDSGHAHDPERDRWRNYGQGSYGSEKSYREDFNNLPDKNRDH